jgi:hypothetical protein
MQVIAWASCCSQGAFSCLLGETWAFKKQFIKTCKLNRWPSNWASQSVPYCCKLAYELLYLVQGSFSASISTSQTSRDMCSVLWVASRENRFFSQLIGSHSLPCVSMHYLPYYPVACRSKILTRASFGCLGQVSWNIVAQQQNLISFLI